jgi:hypothetical protein
MLPRLLALSVLGVCAGLGPAAGPPALPSTTPRVDFARDIQPILQHSCVSCHGARKQRGGLRLDDGVLALQGGNSGVVIRPGNSRNSRLVRLVAGLEPDLRMPPGKRMALSRRQIAMFRVWIDQGATWPRGRPVAGGPVRSKHWAFQPIRRPIPPAVKDASWACNPIDTFILARLEREKIAPSAEADRITLMRRVCLDLTGLPPAPAEVDAFLADTRSGAYERLVERLLASPGYGERWGRHWLDAARYADSDGYEKDTGRPFAWRYRHWVIAALNAGLPYDQFTIEQLAGDLLPPVANAPGSPGSERKVATGFHRNTLTNREGGVDNEQFRVEAVVDRVNTTARVWLGLTLGCAQCHDHKFDPLSQREYYQFFAFFNSDAEVDIAAPLPGYTAVKAQTLAHGRPRKTHVLIRGDFLRPGVEVRPGTPAVLPPLTKPDAQARAFTKPAPTRLDLARWLVSDTNPLTPRVAVNWVWQKHFGRGLVATLEDFGSQGEKPSHPELLDFLAGELVRQGWRLKDLHRLIVTSATYRQSSHTRPELLHRDTYNTLLARQVRQRLEAEIIRDVALAASGLLVRTVGGPSVRPPQPGGISELTYAGSARWIESKGADRHRRGLYTWFQRTSPYPMLLTVDAPDAVLCCVKRERTNTPLQALTLLNDTVFVECAQALARRVLAECQGDTAARLRYAFRLCTARTPAARELVRLRQLYDDLRELCEADPNGASKLAGGSVPNGVSVTATAAWVAVARTILNLDEVLTRE